MAEVNFDKLVKLLKSDDEITQREAAERLGVTQGQLNILLFCRAKVEAGIAKPAPSTAKSVKDLRTKEGERWEMIAARTGLSVAKVKDMAEEGGYKDSYTGRGRDYNGDSKPAKKTTGRKPAAAGKTASGRKPAAAKKGSTAIQRRRTRAGSNNPS
jgi:hypothetical protein